MRDEFKNESSTRWEKIESETLIDTYHVSVRKDKVKLPDGAVIDDFYTVTIPDAAMVAAVTEDGKDSRCLRWIIKRNMSGGCDVPLMKIYNQS